MKNPAAVLTFRLPSWLGQPRRLLWGIALLALFLYAIVTRVYLVTEKPLHHDESLFAYYAYFLSRGYGYDYMPILHGPVLQFLNAALFLLFGDNNLTMRLPAVLGGLAIFGIYWLWKPELGRRGVLAAFALLAVSPSVTYYSRFLRNDVPYLAVTLFCALLLVRAFQTARARYVFGAILAALFMFSMMESSIFFFAACLGFLGTVVAADLLCGGWRARRPTPPAADRSAPVTADAPPSPTFGRPLQTTRSFYWLLARTAALAVLIVALLAWFYFRIWADTLPVHAPVQLIFSKIGVSLSVAAARWTLLVLLLPAVWVLVVLASVNLRRPHGCTGVLHQFLRTAALNKWAVIGAFALSVALYTLFFTTFFSNLHAQGFDHTPGVQDFRGPLKPLTPVQIYKNTWDYWWDQHKLHRIKGPFHYYLPILFLYELPAILIALWGWSRALLARPGRRLHLALFFLPQLVLGLANYSYLSEKIDWDLADAKFHVTSPVHLHLALFYVQMLTHVTTLLFFRGRRVEAFLTFWMVTSLFAYSYAGEKVPWLTVHVAGPLILFAALTVGRLAREIRWTRARRLAAATAIVVAALWQVRSQMFVAFITPASPAERIIYNHTSPDMNYAVERIRTMAHRTNLGDNLPMFIQGEPVWPLYWYLRDMPNAWPPASETLDETTRPIVLVDWHIAVASDNVRQNYVCQRLKVREWWEPPILDFGALADIYRILTPEESRRSGDNAMRWLLAVAEWKKLWHYLVFRQIWIDPANPDWSNGANEFALCLRKDLEERYLTIERQELLPKRPDIPRYP